MPRHPKADTPRKTRGYKTTDADHARLKDEARRRDLDSVNDLLADIASNLTGAPNDEVTPDR
jgi:hypothetical protein